MKLNLERIASIFAAILFLQTLYFKFSGASESIDIFSKLGVEPYGRIGSGILELIVSVLLLFRKTSLLGAILGIVIILGAITSHVLIIGIEVQNDKGLLFGLALLVLVACGTSVYLQRGKLVGIINSYRRGNP